MHSLQNVVQTPSKQTEAGDGSGSFTQYIPTVYLAGPLLTLSLIQDLLEVSGSLGIDAGLVSSDEEKAFDHVKH